jgi:hypothetical protein
MHDASPWPTRPTRSPPPATHAQALREALKQVGRSGAEDRDMRAQGMRYRLAAIERFAGARAAMAAGQPQHALAVCGEFVREGERKDGREGGKEGREGKGNGC